jgi:hypothetical protein
MPLQKYAILSAQNTLLCHAVPRYMKYHEVTLLQRMSSVAVQNCYQLRFLNRCRLATANNLRLLTVILEPLLISIINRGSRITAENHC